MTTSVMWFRRDLRLGDNPALLAAASNASNVLPLFFTDPRLLKAASPTRGRRLLASLAALDADTDGALVVRGGDPAKVVAEVAAEVGAREVHISSESTPYGRRRDDAVAHRLATDGVELVATGSPYAVTPGRVVGTSGGPYRIFTPFLKAWRAHGWRAPAGRCEVHWRRGVASDPLPAAAGSVDVGERAALRRWEDFSQHRLADYAGSRDRPDLDLTSRLSIPLKYGEIHPRTMLAELPHPADADGPGSVARFVAELGWREFYADVLWHDPKSAWRDWRHDLRVMRYDEDAALIDAWRAGRTGYPFVDAGLRQLRDEGWMHNRLRMVTASFLVKDLHAWWPIGARHFLAHLLDADIASNNHGWQWVAGTGTDAAPYFRVFNPVTQGLRFDPDGAYVRRWVPELRHLQGAAAHEPWRFLDGYAHGYPERIVDHAEERLEALRRFEEMRDQS